MNAKLIETVKAIKAGTKFTVIANAPNQTEGYIYYAKGPAKAHDPDHRFSAPYFTIPYKSGKDTETVTFTCNAYVILLENA